MGRAGPEYAGWRIVGPAAADWEADYKDLYGVDVRIGWNPDSFGYNWQLPQIYKRSGVDSCCRKELAWN